MDRGNPYEAAFEGYLQAQRICYVAVDESRRAMHGDLRVKSLDFIVYGPGGSKLLVDVKGRRFPSGPPGRPQRRWESWSTADDLVGLREWSGLFGPGYLGLLVFAYRLADDVELPDDAEDVWPWRGSRYLLRAVEADAYRSRMRIRSPSWGTVWLPTASFREVVRPFCHFLRQAQPGDARECPF